MNLGIFVYNNSYHNGASSNIGDYIQSLASINIYRKIIQEFNNTKYDMKAFINLVIKNEIPNFNFVFIKRDNMHEIKQYNGFTNIVTIMNGWWLHPYDNKGNISFTIPSNITPIFISFHIANDTLLQQQYINELKKYQPIGCRDLKTTNKLKNKGVKAYFSGCLTTTIDFFKWNKQNDTIFNTDTKVKNGIYFSQMNPKWKNIDYKKGLIKSLEILENYSKCKYVNTSRLHCYLPCLAMGVPVNFISPSGNPNIKTWGSKDRFDGLRELQNDPDKFLELKTELKKKTNFEVRKQIFQTIFNTGKTILSNTIIGYDEERINKTQPYYNILAGFIKCFNISNVIEIGTHKGGSGLSMINSNNNLQLVTIDVDEHDMAIERLNKYSNCKRLIGDSLSTKIQNNVKDYLKNKNGKTLLYIDALKDGEWIEKNIEFYKFVKPYYIILDDITIDETMKKWWNKFSTRHNCFNFVDYLGRECRNISELDCGFGLVLCNYEKPTKIIVKNSQDNEWNGEYSEGEVKWKDKGSKSYVKDNSHHIYLHKNLWKLGHNGVKVYQLLGNKIDNEINLNDKKYNEIYLNNKILLSTYKPNIKKYAVMWASTINIGDDIQTLAGINFLKKNGITEYTFIDREKLSDYDGEPVKLIMNGWYTHNLNKFPPSEKIIPIFISIHINNEKLISNNINYFKKYEPIGCRDKATVNLFRKYNIKSCFTGCLTLLFDDVKEKKGGRYLVDVNTNCDYIPNINLDTSNCHKFKFKTIEHDINSKTIYNKPLYITFIFDKNYINIFITVVKSILMNEYSNFKTKIVFLINYFGEDSDVIILKQKVKKIFPKNVFYFKNIQTEYSDLFKKINNCYDFKSAASQIQTASVYCRFYLDSIWCNINDIVLYLDLDIIVRKPISDLFNLFDDKHVLFACPNSTIEESIDNNFKNKFTKIIKDNKNKIFDTIDNINEIINNTDYNLQEFGFNGGVWAINMKKFRDEGYSKKLELCMIVQSKNKIFNHNDQGIMNVVFYKKFKHINTEWNVIDYGFAYKGAKKRNIYKKLNDKFADAKIIHYNGPDKPWKKITHYYPKCVDLWKFYEKFNVNYYYSFLTSIPIKDRLIMAEELLNNYRTAEVVLTTRLHCILPCRAFNTNAIFIHKKYYNDPRFQGLRNIINGDTKIHNNLEGNRNEIEKIRKNFLKIKI